MQSYMQEAIDNRTADEEDYMGDLSLFLPPETSDPAKPSSRKVVLPFLRFMTFEITLLTNHKIIKFICDCK